MKPTKSLVTPNKEKEKNAMKNPIRETAEFKALRGEAQAALAAYADGADFDATIERLAEVGRFMGLLLD